MLRLIGWSAAAAFLGVLLWQATAAQPILPFWLTAILLTSSGVIAGLRIGTDSTQAYISDLQRLNRFLADQNRELEAANGMLLSQLSAEAEISSEKA